MDIRVSGPRKQQILLADVGGRESRAQQDLPIALVGLGQKFFEMIPIEVHVAPKFIIDFVFIADDRSRSALLLRENPTDEYSRSHPPDIWTKASAISRFPEGGSDRWQ